ncbi:hypothetical protein [Methylorubrum thiocyanatum]|uniref:hypothetical protein n=1 Tax=Methylorubrum thiocyanatum TaxID=47958 RepID=UPI003F8122B5
MREAAPRPLTVPLVLAAAALTFAAMALMTFVWWTASPIVGRLYAAVRIAESAGLWLFTGWGRYFTTVPAGEPFAFLSIFKSSVPFGVAASFATAAIGILAYRKRSTRHLDVVLGTPKGGFTAATILREMVPVLPHASIQAAPAPGAGVSAPNTAPTPAAASPNPFGAVRDLRDNVAVSQAQASLSWPEAAALALLLDAIAPVVDRSRPEALLKAAWKAARRVPADRPAPPTAMEQATIQAALTQAMSELTERSVPDLERAHEAVAVAGSTHDVAAALSRIAQSCGRLRVTDFAWLFTVDPLLHTEIVTAQ